MKAEEKISWFLFDCRFRLFLLWP